MSRASVRDAMLTVLEARQTQNQSVKASLGDPNRSQSKPRIKTTLTREQILARQNVLERSGAGSSFNLFTRGLIPLWKEVTGEDSDVAAEALVQRMKERSLRLAAVLDVAAGDQAPRGPGVAVELSEALRARNATSALPNVEKWMKAVSEMFPAFVRNTDDFAGTVANIGANAELLSRMDEVLLLVLTSTILGLNFEELGTLAIQDATERREILELASLGSAPEGEPVRAAPRPLQGFVALALRTQRPTVSAARALDYLRGHMADHTILGVLDAVDPRED